MPLQRPSPVREEGNWEGWIGFFLDGVEASATEAAQTAAKVHDLRERDRRRLGEQGGGVKDLQLLDGLYAQPLINGPWAVGRLGVSKSTSNKMLERFVDAGVLRETTGKQRYRMYRYDEYVELFDPPPSNSAEADETLS